MICILFKGEKYQSFFEIFSRCLSPQNGLPLLRAFPLKCDQQLFGFGPSPGLQVHLSEILSEVSCLGIFLALELTIT